MVMMDMKDILMTVGGVIEIISVGMVLLINSIAPEQQSLMNILGVIAVIAYIIGMIGVIMRHSCDYYRG